MNIRDYINLVEKLSKHATVPPEHMASREASPIGNYLYHGTQINYALSILRENCIDTGINWRGEGERVSLTRSYAVAEEFSTHNDFGDFPVVFVLDWKKLAARFKVIPHNDVDADGNHFPNSASEDGTEQEEAVYGSILPLRYYLVSVNIDPAHIKHFMTDREAFDCLAEDLGYLRFPNDRAVMYALRQLTTSKFLNRVKP